MGKITETFNDKAKTGKPFQPVPLMTNGARPHVIAPHEPLPGEPTPELKSTPVAPPMVVVPGVQPAPEPQPLKIALIGTAPSSRLLAPFGDPSWKIWGCSPGNMNVLPRADAWFELHGNLHWPENKSYGDPYINWLRQLTIPLYMQDQNYCPNATTFPKEDMVKMFGRDFFTSSFSWMMAFAISQGVKELALYGIDMASRDEYILQRPGFYFFRHMAEMRGIKVTAPNESDIMQPPGLYGYSEVTPFGRKILAREQEIKQRLDGMRADRAKLDHNITYLEGAVEDVDYFKSIWLGQG